MIRKLTIILALALFVGAGWVGSAFGADPEDSLIGYWKLDGDTLDASGFENHGTAVGDSTFTTGLFKQAMSFDGDGDYLVINSVANDFTDNDLTLSAWINTEDDGTWQWWFSCNTGSGGNVIILGLISGNIVVHQGAVQITSSAVVNDGAWHHVAYSRIGSVGNLYIDGVFEGTHTANFVLSASDLWSIAQEWDSGTPGDFLEGTVDEVRIYDRGLTEEELVSTMTVDYGVASEPNPADGATDVLREVTMSWTPGDYVPAVNGHTLYFSENFDDVNDGIGGVTLSDNSYTPDPRLDFETTYYWRVDEVNGAPDYTVHVGDVWSFTTEPEGYPITSVLATTNGTAALGQEIENIVNGSGLGADGLHSYDGADMWLADPAADGSLWAQFEFNGVYKLHQMLIWNYNVQFENVLGFGAKDVTVEYSEDGINWTMLGDVALGQGLGVNGYAHNTTIDFDGAAVKYVKLNILSGFGTQAQHGLSEVRFLSIPAYASAPEPADGATDVSVMTTLDWKAGRGAASHEVYLGSDPEDLPLVATLTESVYASSSLELGTTYYWQVAEVNEAEPVSTWVGDVWTFSTEDYIVIEDFESYNDDIPAGTTIWQTWLDGVDNPANGGSQVGYLVSPFAEMTIVRNGNQSMPLIYDTTGVSYAETVRTFEPPQDWTLYGVETLTMFFRGQLDNTGQLYAKINGVKIPYDGGANDVSKITWQTWNIDLASVGTNLTNIQTLVIGIEGANVSGTLFVDDIHLYKVAPLAPREPDNANLVAYYAFEGDVADSSGNGHDGEILGGAGFVTGIVGQALTLDGGDDFIQIADDDSLNPGTGNFSITFWAQLDTAASLSGTAAWDIAVGKRQTGSNGYYVGANRDVGEADQAGFKFMLGNTSAQRVDTPYLSVPVGEWAFIAAVLDRDQNTHKISVNGGSTWANATPPSGSVTPAQDLSFGFDIGPNNYWYHGLIDEVRLYKAALTDAEVAWLASEL